MVAANRPFSRRDVLLAGCGCACAAFEYRPIVAARSAPTYFEGCFITSEGFSRYRSQREGVYPISDGLFARNCHFRTTGDPAIDRDLDRALSIVADLFEVNQAFGFTILQNLRVVLGNRAL